jgi:L-seryl-tRNA(Ser) seleniumtransferase
MRPGGLVLAAMQATALAYLRRDLTALPFWAMATTSVEELRRRAVGVVGQVTRAGVTDLARLEVAECLSVPGGGSLPGMEIPSAGLRVAGDIAAALRASDPPIVARAHGGATICDLRTVDPADDAVIARALGAILAPGSGGSTSCT